MTIAAPIGRPFSCCILSRELSSVINGSLILAAARRDMKRDMAGEKKRPPDRPDGRSGFCHGRVRLSRRPFAHDDKIAQDRQHAGVVVRSEQMHALGDSIVDAFQI
jgi:hypothetical protein